MQPIRALLIATFLAALMSGCGSGSDPNATPGTALELRVLWQTGRGAGIVSAPQTAPDGCRAVGSPCPESAGGSDGFGVEIPPAVQTIRLLFDSNSGDSGDPATHCCLAFAGQGLSSADRHLTLTDLPAGTARVRFSGFATDRVPDTPPCTTSPVGCSADPPRKCPAQTSFPTFACDGGPETPSFDSQTVEVEIVQGERARCNPLLTYAVPFLINRVPTADTQVRFSVVDAGSEVDNGSIQAVIAQAGEATEYTPCEQVDFETCIPCEDVGNDDLGLCSEEGRLEVVSGYQARIFPQLGVGSADVTVSAVDAQGCRMELTYPIDVLPTFTFTPTFTPVPSSTPSPIDTPTPTATPTNTIPVAPS